MSFGEPNNPYGQQQGQPQGNPYGQQAPQGVPPQGYGYPQQPGPGGYPAYPQGAGQQPYDGGPTSMPGGVKAARIMLYVLGGFQAVFGLIMIVASAKVADYIEDNLTDSGASAQDVNNVSDFSTGLLIGLGVVTLAFAAWGILTAVKFSSGRGGIRVSAIVYASAVIAISLLNLLGANLFALISLVLGILIVVFCAKQDGGAWFKRPTY
ncbi:hypothetical protein G3I40_15185 [Streptomyces sp. SID14478]|nr:hypothetical protein [Streptomyces sp. SID14478]